jgi:hypothetical protein
MGNSGMGFWFSGMQYRTIFASVLRNARFKNFATGNWMKNQVCLAWPARVQCVHEGFYEHMQQDVSGSLHLLQRRGFFQMMVHFHFILSCRGSVPRWGLDGNFPSGTEPAGTEACA